MGVSLAMFGGRGLAEAITGLAGLNAGTAGDLNAATQAVSYGTRQRPGGSNPGQITLPWIPNPPDEYRGRNPLPIVTLGWGFRGLNEPFIGRNEAAAEAAAEAAICPPF